ncbi:hypothetical protein O4M32_003617 [Escherichia coli]|nr:hypothetical protein [Escherichia coli]
MLASLGGLVSCAAKVHFKEAGNAMNELIANHDFDFRQLVTLIVAFPVRWWKKPGCSSIITFD